MTVDRVDSLRHLRPPRRRRPVRAGRRAAPGDRAGADPGAARGPARAEEGRLPDPRPAGHRAQEVRPQEGPQGASVQQALIDCIHICIASPGVFHTSSGWTRPANLFVCRLTACNGSRVRSDLTNGPISQRPLANLGNRAIEAANYTLARTNRLLIFGLTLRPYYGKPEGADAVVGCPRVGADFSGGRCPPSGLCGEPRAALDPCRKQEEKERV